MCPPNSVYKKQTAINILKSFSSTQFSSLYLYLKVDLFCSKDENIQFLQLIPNTEYQTENTIKTYWCAKGYAFLIPLYLL